MEIYRIKTSIPMFFETLVGTQYENAFQVAKDYLALFDYTFRKHNENKNSDDLCYECVIQEVDCVDDNQDTAYIEIYVNENNVITEVGCEILSD